MTRGGEVQEVGEGNREQGLGSRQKGVRGEVGTVRGGEIGAVRRVVV